jgi:type III secretion protein J
MSGFACRWLAALGLALIASACRGTLRGGLTEDQANQIAVALDAAQIAAVKVAGPGAGNARRFEVQVANADMSSALRVLDRERLPRPEPPGFAELYGDSGLVTTPNEERARWAAATAGELSRSLERVAGVLDARVHVTPAEPAAALDAPARPMRASVLVRHTAGARPIDEAAVRALVAGAVDGLAPEHVVVIQTESEANVRSVSAIVQVGPISVTRSSVPALKLVLGGALVLDLLLAVALVVLWRNRRGNAT